MKLIYFILLVTFVFSASAQTVTKNFDDIWTMFHQNSLKKKAQELEMISQQESLQRAERHWLPRVYVTGQWFRTNDPTQVFFNNLGQRSIEQADFIPSDLNRPDQQSFGFGTLGIDLALYEGGMKSSQTSMYKTMLRASEIELRAKKSEEYAELARHYGLFLVVSSNEDLLKGLRENLRRIISTYQVGAQSNPVGYSGLLGLKGVDNRIQGVLTQYEMKSNHARQWINGKTAQNNLWRPELKESLKDFLITKLTTPSTSSHSSLILAQEEKLKTLDEVSEMEKARYLPRVGLFAQNNLYDGKRDTETAQSYGIYLQWDLFNPDSYGRMGEARAKAMAEAAKLKAFKQEEKIMLQNLLESKTALENSLKILNDSDRLLQEQSSTAMKLFKSGMLNGLQLAEVINRRVDLVESQFSAQSQYLDIISRIYQLNN
jgi:outer membrane protein TolC